MHGCARPLAGEVVHGVPGRSREHVELLHAYPDGINLHRDTAIAEQLRQERGETDLNTVGRRHGARELPRRCTNLRQAGARVQEVEADLRRLHQADRRRHPLPRRRLRRHRQRQRPVAGEQTLDNP